MNSKQPFKWKHFQGEIILLCVRWYLKYALSYRNLEEIMMERGLSVDHTTIYRWVMIYATQLQKRSRNYLKPTNDSWREVRNLHQSERKVEIFVQSSG
ncbi:MAG TPA: hypothetical protein V6C71_09065 [Coleofasciculaceae cyanobacterium]|jgi:transposase-like protein